jgi:hypothetical protein
MACFLPWIGGALAVLRWQALGPASTLFSIIHRHASTHGGHGRLSSPPRGNWLYISDFIQ